MDFFLSIKVTSIDVPNRFDWGKTYHALLQVSWAVVEAVVVGAATMEAAALEDAAPQAVTIHLIMQDNTLLDLFTNFKSYS